ITPGSHHVEMSYEPQPPRHVLMVVGLLTLIAVGVAERRRDWLAVMVGRGSTALAARPVWAWEPALRRLAAWLEGASAGPRLGAHAPYLGGVAGIALLGGLPLLQLKLMSGHDYLEYLPRNVEFFQGLAAGSILPRWAAELSGGYGEPFFLFNPPLIYYASALFHALGATFIAS